MVTKRIDIRALIDNVIASFPAESPMPSGEWSAEELAVMSTLRETFIAAGAERALREHDPERWLQVGVHLRSAEQSERFLGAELARFARGALDAGDVSRFFYMSKPPGVILRFCGRRLEERFLARLDELLDAERASANIERHERGMYDAETYQFGGVAGLEIFHDFSSYDSMAALDLFALRAQGPRDPDAADLRLVSLVVLNHLIGLVCSDRPERWDVWQNLRLAGRGPPKDVGVRKLVDDELDANRAVLHDAIWNPSAITETLSSEEAAIVARYFEENVRIAARLRDAAQRGVLLYGARTILPFYIIFHWNRWQLGSSTQLELTYFMQTILSPKGP